MISGTAWAQTGGSSPSGGARPAAASEAERDPKVVAKARKLWYRGVEAFRKAEYEKARVAFAECYALIPKSDVLRNLSISEIHAGHYVSAARHLTQLLRAPGDLPAEVRQEAESRLAQAEAQVGQLEISVDVSGADIEVDGDAVGQAPLTENWYVEAGRHEVVVAKAGYPEERREVFALAGVSIPVDVSLETLRREQVSAQQAAELMGTSKGQRPTSGMAADEGLSTVSTVILATTGVVAVAGLVGGIYFTVQANQHESVADGVAVRLGAAGACNSATPFPDACATFSREREAGRSNRERAAVSFVVAGVASAATLGYALWVALSDEEESDTALLPEVGTRSAGLRFRTSF